MAPLAFAAISFAAEDRGSKAFSSGWPERLDRTWVGAEYWANRLQDWRVRAARLECIAEGPGLPFRTVHLLTHRLGEQPAEFEMSVRTGRLASNRQQRPPADSVCGFLVGVGGSEMDYRGAAIVHEVPGQGGGILAGLDGAGRPVLQDFERPATLPRDVAGQAPPDVVLRLAGKPAGEQYELTLSVHDPESDQKLVQSSRTFPSTRLSGGVALVSHPGSGRPPARHWFRDWMLSGEMVESYPERRFGPIACTQYTLSDTGGKSLLKLTAQLLPIGENEPQTVELEVLTGDGIFKTVAEAEVVVPGWTATFRVPDWHSTLDWPCRVVYAGDVGNAWTGTIRQDPVDTQTIVVAGFTGNHNCRSGFGRPGYNYASGMWFPHADLTAHVAKHQPDVLFFSGDQVYEGGSPTPADRSGQPSMYLDYMYKWYLWCWAFGDLARDRPCVAIPDDHDVYQGNIWGENGRPARVDHDGGYVHPAEFAKMVERTQCSHLPDPYDPTPVEQGIGVYYAPMTYGRISFAILEDRKFKSGCNGRVPESGSTRPDHITDPDFDVTKADVPGLKLLGDRQITFLRDWSDDWDGADLKLALSQTTFANLATHHGAGLDYLRADLDSNGWPQSGRNRALAELRRGFAFHLCGDQHLATLVQHGIDTWDDAIWAFCVPSIANFYPRAWAPKNKGPYAPPEVDDYTGRFRDGLMNYVTVYAATNPGRPTGHEPAALHDRMPGYGIVRLDKQQRTYTAECWPRFADPENPQHRPYLGWPKTIDQLANYGKKPAGYLPPIVVSGGVDPVVEVIDEDTGELIYALRIKGTSFRPMVFENGSYTVNVDGQTFQGVEPGGEEPLKVKLK